MLTFLRPSKQSSPASELSPAKLLVIAKDKQKADWAGLLSGIRLQNGQAIEVVQTGWDDILVSSEPKSSYARCCIHCRGQNKSLLDPDLVLVRNEVTTPQASAINQLYGLMMGGVQGINSLSSIVSFTEKVLVQAELHRLNRELGDDVFPVIEQCYFSDYRDMMYSQSFPAVVKIGSAHAGMGKMIIRDHHEFEDFRTVLAMTDGKYCTAEPFLEGEYDLRIQKIGPHYRAFKRRSVSGAWKTNTGTAMLEAIEVNVVYRRWADEASVLFGGLDILTVDAIHDTATGKEFILEVNGTSSGFAPDFDAEDNLHVRELVLERLNSKIMTRCPPPGSDETAEAAAQEG